MPNRVHGGSLDSVRLGRPRRPATGEADRHEDGGQAEAQGELEPVVLLHEHQDEHLADCMLCGSCSYVCPSSIPLAQMFSLSKAALRRQVAK